MGWPHQIDEESDSKAKSAPDLSFKGVAKAAKVTVFEGSCVLGSAGVVHVWDEAVFHLPQELEEEDDDECNPLPHVEVYEVVVKAVSDAELSDVVWDWVP